MGGASADHLSVRMHFELRSDGSIVGAPRVLNSENTAFFLAAADSAVRAVMQCQPYNLPESLYSHWKAVTLNFKPSEMFGG